MKLVVFGASGHASVVIDVIERRNCCQIAGLIDNEKPTGLRVLGYEVLGAEQDLPGLLATHEVQGGLVAVGDNWTRQEAVARIERAVPRFTFPVAIHPDATVAPSATVGRGTVIMAGAVINSRARVGEFCIVNTKASLDHDSVLEDFASLAPGVTIGGNVHVGRCTAICLGASVIHGLRVGEHSVVGAGATVVADIPPYVVAYGSPARVVRPRKAGDRYL